MTVLILLAIVSLAWFFSSVQRSRFTHKALRARDKIEGVKTLFRLNMLPLKYSEKPGYEEYNDFAQRSNQYKLISVGCLILMILITHFGYPNAGKFLHKAVKSPVLQTMVTDSVGINSHSGR